MSEERTRIGVTGGRHYDLMKTVAWALGEVNPKTGTKPILVHGGAAGADLLCATWAERAGWKLEPHIPTWSLCSSICPKDDGKHRKWRVLANGSKASWCPLAGFSRNQEMVDSGLDMLFSFPGNNGTADMTRRAKLAGIHVIMVTVRIT